MFNTSVISGHGRGKGLGFPTLNLIIPKDLKAEHGIYAGWVWIQGEKLPGAFHFGPIPVYREDEVTLEVFVLDSDVAQTPQKVSFDLVQYLHEVRNYPSPEILIKNIALDVKQCREILKTA